MRKRWSDIYIYILKGKKLNNKGFTLVELLVTIAILGIIAGMSFPMLRKLSEANQQKKYKVYAQSLNSSAKLYVDSYGEDLFGSAPYGCATVTYEELNNKLATKDIQTSDLSCFSDKTFVTVRKSHDNYSYYSQIGCGTKKSNNTKLNDSEVTVTYSLGDNTGDCSGTSSGYTLTSYREKDEDKDKKSIDVNVIIQNSITGINKADGSVKLSYKWTTEKNVTVNDSDWKEVKFNSIPTNSKQEKEILKGNTITIKSNKIKTPNGQTGIYYLAIKQESIYDIYMSDIVNAKDKTTVKYLGPFIIDNTKPDINTFTVSSNSTDYNSVSVTANINATDDKYTPNNKLKVYVYESSDSKKVECDDIDIKKLTKDDKALSTKSGDISKKITLSGKQDGKERTIKLVVEDLAGNRECDETTYTPDAKYNITYSLNGGAYGDKHPETAYIGREVTISNSKKSVTAKFDTNGTGATISSVENKTGDYTFSGWSSNSQSGLNKSAKTGSTSANISWNGSNTTNTKFLNLATYNTTVTMSASYKGPSITLPTITKTGYTCKWNSESNCEGDIEKTSGGTYTPSSATKRTFYACCNVKTIKVTFHKNDNSNITDTQTFTYGKKDQKFSNKKWTRTSYNLLGWSSSSNATTKEYSTLSEVTDNWINNNSPSIDLYAVWQEKTHCPGNICYISSKGNDSTGYGTEDEPYATIQKGYNTISTGGTISLLTNITQTTTLDFGLDKDITLQSKNNNSIIRGNNLKYNIIYLSKGKLTLKNITIDGNNVEASKCMVKLWSTAVIESGTVIKNGNNCGTETEWYHDGGVNSNSTLTINGGEIKNNYGTNIGGISSHGSTAVLIINGGTISDNKGKNVGGVYSEGSLTITGGTIKDNKLSDSSGKVYKDNLFAQGSLNVKGKSYINQIDLNPNTNTKIYDKMTNPELDIEDEYYYSIVNKNSSKSIDIKNGSLENGTSLQLWTSNNSDAQKFRIAIVSTNGSTSYYHFVTVHKIENNKDEIFAIDFKDNDRTKIGGSQLQIYNSNYTTAQQYYLESASEGYYYIKIRPNSSSEEEYCIDAKGASKENGTAVQMYKCNNTDAQKWKFIKIN